MVKNLPAIREDGGETGLIPGSRGSSGGENGTHSSILDWEIPWTEEPGGLQSRGFSEVSDTT